MIKEFIPVIHITNNNKDLERNIKIILENNITHIMLISHGYLDYIELLDLGKELKSQYHNLWIGYNFLDLSSSNVFKFLLKGNIEVDGIWIDNSYVGLNQNYANELKKLWLEYKNKFNNSLYFGGVAFKYLPQPQYIDKAILESKTMMDVVTTTGSGTGNSISKEKINLFNRLINNDTNIGIASGISIDNIDYLFNKANYFLVSSSISKNDSLFDENKLKLFNDKFNFLKGK